MTRPTSAEHGKLRDIRPASDVELAVRAEHDRNLEFFLAHQDDLCAMYPGQFLLIYGGGEVAASADPFELNDLRNTFDDVTRCAALLEICGPWQRGSLTAVTESLDSTSRETLSAPPTVTYNDPPDDRAKAEQAQRDRNHDYFIEHIDDLFEQYPAHWLLIHSGGQVEAFDDLVAMTERLNTFDKVTRGAALRHRRRTGLWIL